MSAPEKASGQTEPQAPAGQAPQGQTPAEQAPPEQPNSLRMVATLAIVAAVSGLLIVGVYQATLPRIKANRAEALRNAVFQVLPGARSTRTFYADPQGNLKPMETEMEKAVKYYAGYDEGGRLIGVAIEAQGQGYQDVIRILYGYDPQGEKVVGMRVLESKETPGLGDKIAKDPIFLKNFAALDVALKPGGGELVNPVEVVKSGTKTREWQIDGITGATISSKAIGRILNESAVSRMGGAKAQINTMKEAQ